MEDVKVLLGDVQPMVYTANYFYGIDRIEIEQILLDAINIKGSKYVKYVAEDYDCDDYAQALHGLFNQQTLSRLVFGIACSDLHCFNSFIDRDKQVWIKCGL